MTQSAAAVTIHPSWFEHPLVARAIERSNGDPVDVLLNVHKGLCWLDRHARGATFEQVLAKRVRDEEGGGLEGFRRGLVAAGATEEQAQAVLDYEAPRIPNLQRLPVAEKMAIRKQIVSLHRQGWPAPIIARHMGVSDRTVFDQINNSGAGRLLDERQKAIAREAIETSNTRAARNHGVALSTVSRWRQCYQASLEEA